MQVFKQRHCERVVLGDVSLLLSIPGEERKPDNPRIMERLRIIQLELGGHPDPQAGKCHTADRLGIGDDQDQVAGPGFEMGSELVLDFGAKNLAVGPVSVSFSTLSQIKPLAPMPAIHSVRPSRSLRL